MPGMYEVAGPGAGVQGSAGVQIVFRFPSKGWADRAEDNENSHYRAGGEVCVLSSLWQTWSRVATGVGRQTNARRCHYVWAAASEPPAFWPLIVQAFHRQHRATAITHSSKRACNRKDSCPSHILFEALCLSKASGLGDAVRGLMSCGRSSLPCRDDRAGFIYIQPQWVNRAADRSHQGALKWTSHCNCPGKRSTASTGSEDTDQLLHVTDRSDLKVREHEATCETDTDGEWLNTSCTIYIYTLLFFNRKHIYL